MILEYFSALFHMVKHGERPVSLRPAISLAEKRKQGDTLAKRWHHSTKNLSTALEARSHELHHATAIEKPTLFSSNPKRGTAHTHIIGQASEAEYFFFSLAGLLSGATSQTDLDQADHIAKRSGRSPIYFERIYKRRFGIPLSHAIERHNTIAKHRN